MGAEDAARLSGSRDTQDARADLMRSLDHLPEGSRGAAALEIASELIEAAAYDLAGLEASPRVARLILMSAEVARVAAAVRDEAPASGAALREAC